MSLIKVYFQPGTNPDSAVTTIASLAMAEISHLPPRYAAPPFRPQVRRFQSAGLYLVTLKGEGLSETQLKDISQNVVRNQLAGVPESSRRAAAVRRTLAADDALRRSRQARIA